jgi:hypothetical protein
MKTHATTKARPKRRINWDDLFKAITVLVAVAGLVFGVYQYRANGKRAEIEKANEAARIRREEQTKLCLNAIKVASEFAHETQSETADAKKRELWGLFAQINVVENTAVIEAIKKFRETMKEWERVNNPPSFFLAPSKFDRDGITFDKLAEELEQAMRASLLTLSSNQPPPQHIQRRL